MGIFARFEKALEEEGIDVIEAAESPDTDHDGFVSINTTLEIEGETFDGEVMYLIYEDRIESHGADIWQTQADVKSGSDREALLDRVSAIRDDDVDGSIWTYHQRDDVEDNLDKITTRVETTFEKVQAKA